MSRSDHTTNHALSPFECGKMLDNMKELEAQLLFLTSMKPSQQISTLANAEEKTRESILITISELSRREITRHIAAFQATNGSQLSLDTLPTEILDNIMKYLSLAHVKQLRSYSGTFKSADDAIRHYYRVVNVDTGYTAARKLEKYFKSTLSQYTELVIIRERPRDWADDTSVLRSFRKTLESTKRDIKVILRCSHRGGPGLFLREFDQYKGLIELENIEPRHIRHTCWSDYFTKLTSVQSVELVLHKKFNGYCQGTIILAEPGLLSFVSQIDSGRKLSVIHQRDLELREEQILDELLRSGLNVTKTQVSPDLYLPHSYEISLTEYLDGKGVVINTELIKCYININNY